ncbi:hypothetical protein PR202_gn00779 [Eleusine coracana subsp. coracana]|uniref:F-box domain-containing protein n=1 Tax=Eleusine coracana subsp. coracana TaxID=191504 RepID=A0AAV5G462_ELECO|nr:hypothetical protein PR202_gn00779 [Eleusine coracana subsp. coracana]
MLRRKRSKNGAAAAPVEDEIDRLSALPDDALRQVLDLLPANEVVRTSVLAQRWRHLWKSTTVLCVRSEDERSGHVKELREFVDHLLLLRGGAPLERYELWFFGFDDEDVPRVNLWFRHVVMCKVRILRLEILRAAGPNQNPLLELDDLPIVSQNLMTLKLYGPKPGFTTTT